MVFFEIFMPDDNHGRFLFAFHVHTVLSNNIVILGGSKRFIRVMRPSHSPLDRTCREWSLKGIGFAVVDRYRDSSRRPVYVEGQEKGWSCWQQARCEMLWPNASGCTFADGSALAPISADTCARLAAMTAAKTARATSVEAAATPTAGPEPTTPTTVWAAGATDGKEADVDNASRVVAARQRSYCQICLDCRELLQERGGTWGMKEKTRRRIESLSAPCWV